MYDRAALAPTNDLQSKKLLNQKYKKKDKSKGVWGRSNIFECARFIYTRLKK